MKGGLVGDIDKNYKIYLRVSSVFNRNEYHKGTGESFPDLFMGAGNGLLCPMGIRIIKEKRKT